jgi:hypothetical protein
MQHRRGDDPLKRLLEPGNAPYLFILGSTFLAVLGEGVYGLLQDVIGDSWISHLATIAASLLIFGSVTLWFWFRARGGDESTMVPVERRASGHAGLVLLVGPNPRGPEAASIAHHQDQGVLRHCWLISSPEADERARSLAAELEQGGIDAHLVPVADAHKIDMAYDAVRQALEEARRTLATDEQVIVDITGSTKVVTAGAVLACLDADATMEYMATKRDSVGKPDPTGAPVAMAVEMQSISSPRRETTRTDGGTADEAETDPSGGTPVEEDPPEDRAS